MSAVIMDGNALLKEYKQIISMQIRSMKGTPGLAIIMVGDNPASKVYIGAKKKDCAECGIKVYEYVLNGDVNDDQLIDLIHTLNNDNNIDGILVQLPLPESIADEYAVLSAIRKDKDVDDLLLSETNTPCTPLGIMTLLNTHHIDLDGKKCVIINRSNLIGIPLAKMMIDEDATVTVCHSHTKNLIEECRTADVLVTATGGGVKITEDWVKEGAVLIDASTNRDENGKPCGDAVWSDALLNKVSHITPVPGGVGPMTRAMLLFAVREAAYAHGKD